jgi:hypothetical protein
MDNNRKYATGIAIALLALAAVPLLKSKATTNAVPASQNLELQADQYVIEGFPLNNHITFFGPNNTLKDLGYTANDAGNSEWDVWSAARILTEIENITPYNVDDTSLASSTVLWSSDKIASEIAAGPGGILIDDAQVSPTLTWSSQNIQNEIQNVINDTQTSPSQTWSSQQITAALAATPGTTANVIDDNSVAPVTTWSSSKIDTALKALPSLSDTTTSPSSAWSSQKVNAMLGGVIPTIVAATPGDIPIITATGSLSDSGYRIDDTTTSVNALWTSNAINNALSEKLSSVPNSAPNQIAIFDGTGGIQTSGVVIQDNAPAGTAVLWSSAKTTVSLGSKQNLVPGSSAGNLSFFDANGQVIDKGIVIDDTAPASTSVLWSSQNMTKALAKSQMLVSGAKVNRVATFDSNGQVLDSGFLVDDGSAPSSSVLWSSTKTKSALNNKQNLVSGVVNGNLASFDANGQVLDSLYAVKDDVSASSSVLWSSAKTESTLGKKQNLVPSAIFGNLASFDATGQVVDSGSVFSDSLPAANNVVWSSQKIQNSQLQMQKLVVPKASGNLATLNASGEISDSGVAVNDSLPPSSSVIWSSEKLATQISSLPYQKLGSGSSGNLLMFDANGQSIESSIKLDDASVSATGLWSSQKLSTEMQSRVAQATIGSIATFDANGQVADSGTRVLDTSAPDPKVLWSSTKTKSALDNKQNLISSPISGAFVTTDGRGQTAMSPYSVNDSAVGPTVLWSSAKISGGVPTGQAGNITVLAQSGSGVSDSGVKIDDAAAASPSVLWSSQKMSSMASIADTTISPTSTWSSEQSALAIQNMSSTKMNTVPTAPVQSIARFSTGGQVESSGFVIDDTALAASALWSSLKTDATYQKLMASAGEGTIPVFDAKGQVVASTIKVADLTALSSKISISKSLTNGSFVVLDGIRFYMKNPSGLFLQQDGTNLTIGAWVYSTLIRNGGTSTIIAQTPFYIPAATQQACTPTWGLAFADMVTCNIRISWGTTDVRFYRLTYTVETSPINVYQVTVEKL